MKKKNYFLVTKYPHQTASLSEDVKKITKGQAKHVINWCGGPSYITLGEMTFLRSLWVSFRIGMILEKHFINKDDIEIMVQNQ